MEDQNSNEYYTSSNTDRHNIGYDYSYDNDNTYYDNASYEADGSYYDERGNWYENTTSVGYDESNTDYDQYYVAPIDNNANEIDYGTSTSNGEDSQSLAIAQEGTIQNAETGGFGVYATPRPETPPPHWREKEMTKRILERVDRRRVHGVLATAGMAQLKQEVLAYEDRVSKGAAILRSKKTLKLKQALDQRRKEVGHQGHVSQLLMRCVETQENIAARLKINQDVARQDLLKQLPKMTSVQERVHRLRSMYTHKAAAESSAEAVRQDGSQKSSQQIEVNVSNTIKKPMVSGKLRVKEELRAAKPIDVDTMFQHLHSPSQLENMLDSKRSKTSGRKMIMPGESPMQHQEGKGNNTKWSGDNDAKLDINNIDPYVINRRRQEQKLKQLLLQKGRQEADECGIDPVTGCIAPQKPLRLKARAVSASIIQLNWSPPVFDGGQPILDYVVYYTPCTIEHIGKRVVKNYAKEEHFFTTRWFKRNPVAHHGFTWHFRIGKTTVSNIYVRAVNVVGQGDKSDPVYECTQPYTANPSRPVNVVVDKITTRSIYIRWYPPLDDGGCSNCPVSHYI